MPATLVRCPWTPPNSEPGEVPGLEGSESPSGLSEQPSGQLDQPDSSPSHLESEQQSQQQFDDFLIDAPGQCLISPKLCIESGKNLQAFWRNHKGPFWASLPSVGKRQFRVRLSGSYQVADIEEFLTSFTKDIKSHLQDRFPHSNVLECYFIFDPKSYVNPRYDELPKFGLPELQKLLVHFGKMISAPS